jgi:hypothetical protein
MYTVYFVVKQMIKRYLKNIGLNVSRVSVGVVTGYGLDGPGIESRWGAGFPTPVQIVSGAHQASCTMAKGSFPGVKCGRGVTLTPHPF